MPGWLIQIGTVTGLKPQAFVGSNPTPGTIFINSCLKGITTMKRLFLILALLVSTSVYGSECSELYPENKPIEVLRAVELCNSFYVSVYDPQIKAVLFTSERLKRGSPVGSQIRITTYRSDKRIPDSPAIADYRGSGYDRGHMAPADDASTATEMYDTFVLTNMTPQDPTLNRVEWKALEEKIRKMFLEATTDMYVVTIADYEGSTRTVNGIPVPTGYWKVVYVNESVKFFYAANQPKGVVVQKNSVALRALIK